MTIRKYLGCDGPECISNLEVELASPLRDILPGNWTAIMIQGDQAGDYHFCSLRCLCDFAVARAVQVDDKTEPEDGAAGAGVLVQPKPSGDLDSGAVKPAAQWIREQLRQVMAGPFNPPPTFTYTWPDIVRGGGASVMNQGAALASGAYAGFKSGATPPYPVAREMAGALLR